MTETVKIRKGSINNVVPLEAFNSLYKINGWEIVGEEPNESDLTRELNQKGIINENQQNAYVQAKIEKGKMRFNDGLFKGE